MTDRIHRLARDTNTPSHPRDSQNTDYVLDIPLLDLRGNTPESDDSEVIGLITSHFRNTQEQAQQHHYYPDEKSSVDRPWVTYDDTKGPMRDPFISRNSDDVSVVSFKSEEFEEESTSSPDFERRWYFKDMESGSSSTIRHLELLEESQDPVVIDVTVHAQTQLIEWQIPAEGIPQGTFELVLGISSQDLDLDAVDCFTFDIVYDTNKKSCHRSETIPSKTLHGLFEKPTMEDNGNPSTTTITESSNNVSPIDASDILRWRLHERITIKTDEGGVIRVAMSIETWEGISPDPGAIRLHFLEVLRHSYIVYRDDRSYREHHPFTWCIDVNDNVHSDIKGPAKEIISYCFSGDGAFVALLTYSTMGQHLELYQIDQDRECPPRVAWRTLSTSKTTVFDISVSWDGSQIVVFVFTRQRPSILYSSHRRKDDPPDPAAENLASSESQYFLGRLHPQLQHYRGKGTFYASTTLGNVIENELFVAFDGKTVTMCKVFGTWEVFKSISLGDPERNLGDAIMRYPDWKEHLRGGRLVLLDKDRGYVSTRDLFKEFPLIAMDIPPATSDNPYIATCLSECGRYFVMAARQKIDVHLTDTWSRLGSWTLPAVGNKSHRISSAYFISGSGCIVVDTTMNREFSIHSHGYVVDIRTMTTVNRIHSKNLRHYLHNTFGAKDCSASMLLYQSHTTLGAVQQSDRLVRPSSRLATKCTGLCHSGIVSRSPTSTEFQVEVVKGTVVPGARHKPMSLISIAAKSAANIAVEVMSLPLQDGSALLDVNWTFVTDHVYLVIVTSSLVLVWRIPMSFDGDYDLLLAQEITTTSDWSVCRHQQLHGHERATNDKLARNVLDPHLGDARTFMDGTTRLIQIFKDADERSKRGIVRYFERHINQYRDPKDDSVILLSHLCTSWKSTSHEHLLAFIRSLFGSSTFRWIPAAVTRRETNTLSILLKHHSKYGRPVVDIAEIIVRYCVRQAIADSDLFSLGPVFLALRAAINCKDIDMGQLARTMRSFAYIPARDYHFAMDHYASTASIYKFREWNMKVHERKQPVLYLTSENADSPKNERPIPHLYIASFDMLWAAEDIPVPKYRPLAIAQSLLLRVTFTSRKRYVPHPFNVKDLDNPALAALVRFKWRQLGFIFWLFKVIFYGVVAGSYIFHMLLLSTDPQKVDSLKINDLIISIIFVICGLISFFLAMGSARDLLGVEIFAALMPTIAVIVGVVDIDQDWCNFLTALSFLFIFLQLLFEFRVMKTIGSFLSVLWQALRSARILILVYAYMLFTYGIAFMFLLRFSCDDEDENVCKALPPINSTDLLIFPSTYFMTGGIYDLVEDPLDKNDWKFYFLLASFLFMVTIMLNILIGMITHAFGNDDRTSELEWMESRMLFVVRAENTFRSLPYFRNITSWFPERIYYTATPQEVRDYKLESQRLAKNAETAALLLPTEPNLKRLGSVVVKAMVQANNTEQQQAPHQKQQRKQAWVDRLREDMKTEFKEELREQLEEQKRQSDEQITQLNLQLSEILTVLRAGSRGG
ncbi:hypothetical protein K457DRAFT_14108 [Linnemannia elongata AG-77]|uniref:Ion transport domain-containing protein n=1 Tax=Linnemannia elongata AG-77 TaxID=1314771 RepID=A0A197KBN0_9FUNG|nr:hypothetical protein K457DRAFT_14108 [Linnemannia elongata AG-77]